IDRLEVDATPGVAEPAAADPTGVRCIGHDRPRRRILRGSEHTKRWPLQMPAAAKVVVRVGTEGGRSPALAREKIPCIAVPIIEADQLRYGCARRGLVSARVGAIS